MNTLNLYLISQTDNNTWDTYDSAVVAAYSKDEAKKIHPNGDNTYFVLFDYMWTSPDKVEVQLIGKADKSIAVGSVICASYNAG